MNCQITEPLKMSSKKTCNTLSVEMQLIQLDHLPLKDTFLMGSYRMLCYLVVHFKRRKQENIVYQKYIEQINVATELRDVGKQYSLKKSGRENLWLPK